jgi:hypothetical protein
LAFGKVDQAFFDFLFTIIWGYQQCSTISICWGSSQYSAAAVHAVKLRMAISLRRLCGVLASIPQPFGGRIFIGLLSHYHFSIAQCYSINGKLNCHAL